VLPPTLNLQAEFQGLCGTDASRELAFCVFCEVCGIPAAPGVTIPSSALTTGITAAAALLATTKDAAGATWEGGVPTWLPAAVAAGALWAASGPAAQAPASALDEQGFRRWTTMCPTWLRLITSLLTWQACHTVSSTPTAAPLHPLLAPRPVMRTPPGRNVSTLLLHPLVAHLLSSAMPAAHAVSWRLLYSSDGDGKSFSTLMARLGAVEGATLILVREVHCVSMVARSQCTWGLWACCRLLLWIVT
jgi:hypothetical protein